MKIVDFKLGDKGNIEFLVDENQNKIEFRKETYVGPALSIVHGEDKKTIQFNQTKQNIFEAADEGMQYVQEYCVEQGVLQVKYIVKNNTNHYFEPTALRVDLGVDSQMDTYPEWRNRYFPTLLRCEKSFSWGYFMSPDEVAIGFCTQEPVASWGIQYKDKFEKESVFDATPPLGDLCACGHQTKTGFLDLIHTLPLPEHHPQDLTKILPGETKEWTINLFLTNGVDNIKEKVSTLVNVPVIQADVYSVLQDASIHGTVCSKESVTAKLIYEDGTQTDFEIKGNSFALKHDGSLFGVVRLVVTNQSGKTSEAKFTFLKPLSFYMTNAAKGAVKNGQYASTHLEQFLGLHTGTLVQKYVKNDAYINKINVRLDEIFATQWHDNGCSIMPKGNTKPFRYMSNSAQMVSIMVDKYEVTKDIAYLEKAVRLADYVMTCQQPEGYYNYYNTFEGDKRHYTSVFYPAKSMMELLLVEKELAKTSALWQERYLKHYDSVERAMENLVELKDNIQTEGQEMFEDGMISCSATQLSMFALLQEDKVKRNRYKEAAEYMMASHNCLSQLLIPDSRVNGATMRYWEAQWDVLIRNTFNMLNSPHGWSGWKIYGLWYMYQLTYDVKWLYMTLNAISACIQVVDNHSGELRWSFMPEPHREVVMLQQRESDKVDNCEPSGKGERVFKIIGEEYIPMIGAFHFPTQEPAEGNSSINGWCCNNDVHEIFKALDEITLTRAFLVLDNENHFHWNCSVKDENGVCHVYLNEEMIDSVCYSFADGKKVVIYTKHGEQFEYELSGNGEVILNS